jgi:hypothetical protein
MMPWTFFLVPGYRPRALSRELQPETDAGAGEGLGRGSVIFFILGGKLPGYIMSVFPALAMIIARSRTLLERRTEEDLAAAFLRRCCRQHTGFAVYTNDQLMNGTNWWRWLIYLPRQSQRNYSTSCSQTVRAFVLARIWPITSLVVARLYVVRR